MIEIFKFILPFRQIFFSLLNAYATYANILIATVFLLLVREARFRWDTLGKVRKLSTKFKL